MLLSHLACKQIVVAFENNTIDPSTRLRRAIILGDVALAQRIIRTYPKVLRNPDFEDKSNTSLHLAAVHGYVDIAALLIDFGHEDEGISWNSDRETPLMLAARHAQIRVGGLLVEKFPRCVQFVNQIGMDALALSCQNSASTSLVPHLLSNPTHPASPYVTDHDGNTPLHHASASGSLKALRILLAAGANPLAKNKYDWTPLAYSQTVAAEVYFKNLVAEFERKKVESARLGEEKERQRTGGLRMVEGDGGNEQTAHPINDDEAIGDALRRQWSPVERRRPTTPGGASLPRHDWGTSAMRTRAGSGD